MSEQADDGLDTQIQRDHLQRLTMLSDGIFAIATKLAALEIHLPADAPTLAALLGDAGRTIGAYVVSFFIIAVFWISNRDLFARLRRVDLPLTMLTLSMLCIVALIPATAHVVYKTGSTDVPFRFYALVMAICGTLSPAKWAYATARPGLMEPEFAARFGWEPVVFSAVMPLIFALLLVVPVRHSIWLAAAVAALILFRRVILPRWSARAAVRSESP